MNNDWTGNKKTVFTTLGASNHTDKERQCEDYYATDPIAIDVLIGEGGVSFPRKVWECSCGEGHLSKRLEEHGIEVISTDLVDRGYGKGGVDFLATTEKVDMDILTNPPYKYARVKKFVEDANINIYDPFCVADFYFDGDTKKAKCECFSSFDSCKGCWKREIDE